ncbi:tRNA (adenine-N(1))-methyltransferase [Listeria monocytogenes]|uniref:tRNA (Adenine(22)-N(1))-methyltransferase TrmK n=1 Tax=Listeria monocytogenes TaxID=1639 RepID=A0A9P2BX04_LISMN|nr:tRNA (adenine(22)-N(1))-methyltransferase TrmK [Listeria monocytogenes]EAF4567599.1 tRNA (adenine-N(1))-methyltransferase [Listeria monocytogenes serotype 1/2a]EHC6201607.1 tRNA (adenine-N(1))-methyltransferase [Listeria monocytogenes serotype 1/2c]EAC2546114.1 tRNA (adenine-N(1))-methyltransferase [Listeria monocytogenes]EAC4365428.1 tRNA (adenine-N(1))-methyltransferase [Listeria monocytogenes]EAC5655268.1 tRNA (adenine-N(1))-methyltransferase [Listeria monocytogenes]
MNEEQLSKRLEKVASYITKNERIADIGSDHAYLPCFAVKNQTASFAIAGEVVDGPFQSAQKQVRSSGLTEYIDVRKGNGLAVIEKKDVIDTIVIAGMGGALIRTILEEGAAKLAGVTKLILQPNIAAWQLREWSEQNNWLITSEAILREDNKIYEIMVLAPSKKPVAWTKQEIFFGPCLLKDQSAIFKSKWRHEANTWQNIIQTISNNQPVSPENQAKIRELEHKIALVEDVLK